MVSIKKIVGIFSAKNETGFNKKILIFSSTTVVLNIPKFFWGTFSYAQKIMLQVTFISKLSIYKCKPNFYKCKLKFYKCKNNLLNQIITSYAQKIRLQVTFISKKPKIVNLQV